MMQKTKRKRDKISSPGRGWRPALVNLIALACLLGAAAAGSAQEAPEAGGTAAAARAVPQVASVSEALEDESFHYDPAGRRDPFKSLLDLQSKAKDVSMLPPIQQLDLNEIKIIGTRHGEKLLETLLNREEIAIAQDLGDYYRISVDTRDLNYNKYFIEGEQQISGKEDYYTSNNTRILNVEEIKEVLLKVDYIQEELGR